MTNRIRGEGYRTTMVCIDSYENGVPVGRIYHPHLDHAKPFRSTMQFLQEMEQLMDQYAGLVYAVVKARLTQSFYISSDIQDCVADVFSEFYENLSQYDPSVSSIKTYLCVLARNNATDVLRKRARQRNDVSLDDSDNFLSIADDITLESELAEKELRSAVFAAIKALGEPDVSILIRKYYLGESSKEIADALTLTVANVDTRTHRALNKLRKLFGGNDV